MLTYSCTANILTAIVKLGWSVFILSFCAGQLSCGQIQEIGFTMYQVLEILYGDSSWHITCLESITTKLSMLFQVLGLWLHLKEIFFQGLGLIITGININKHRITTIKNKNKIDKHYAYTPRCNIKDPHNINNNIICWPEEALEIQSELIFINGMVHLPHE